MKINLECATLFALLGAMIVVPTTMAVWNKLVEHKPAIVEKNEPIQQKDGLTAGIMLAGAIFNAVDAVITPPPAPVQK